MAVFAGRVSWPTPPLQFIGSRVGEGPAGPPRRPPPRCASWRPGRHAGRTVPAGRGPARRLHGAGGLGSAGGPRAARPSTRRHRQCPRGGDDLVVLGARLLRAGPQLPPRLRLDRGRALVPPGAAARSEPGHGARRPQPRVFGPGRARGRPARAREGPGPGGEGQPARASPDRGARTANSTPSTISPTPDATPPTRRPSTRRWPRTSDDVELWLLRGNAEEPTAAGRGQRGGVGSVAFYERALRLQPDNGAAHHYLTHSFETIGQIPAALEHGEVYAGIAPAVPHSHHMWGHDLRRVGRIDDAIAAFRRTVRSRDGLLRGGEDLAGDGLAPRPQPRPARHRLSVQGTDAAGREDAARDGGPAAGDRLPRVQPEDAGLVPARSRARDGRPGRRAHPGRRPVRGRACGRPRAGRTDTPRHGPPGRGARGPGRGAAGAGRRSHARAGAHGDPPDGGALGRHASRRDPAARGPGRGRPAPARRRTAPAARHPRAGRLDPGPVPAGGDRPPRARGRRLGPRRVHRRADDGARRVVCRVASGRGRGRAPSRRHRDAPSARSPSPGACGRRPTPSCARSADTDPAPAPATTPDAAAPSRRIP